MTMQEIAPATGTAPGRETHEALRSAALGPHEHIAAMLDAACQRQPGNEPRRARQLADTFMATTCRHLTAIDDALLPVARRRLTGGRHLVTEYVLQSKELEVALHMMKARLYGDVRHSRRPCGELWARVRQLLAEHEGQENVIVDGLEAVLSEHELAALGHRLRRTEERAPTRPHPYSPHTGLVGRVTHRVWSVVDGFWDTAEGRVIPHQAPPLHPARDSLLTRYALGAPRFDDPRRAERRSA